MKANVRLPSKLLLVFSKARGEVRFRGVHGGRGSGKSYNFAKMAAIFGLSEQLRILCVREYQNSIKESFYAEVKRAIESEPWLSAFYDVGVDFIRGKNGTDFLFKGLRHNVSSIKSMAGIDLCIVEEAEDISETSWQILLPTVREPKSEIWVIWNPKRKGSPVDRRFKQSAPDNAVVVEMNHADNPFFTKELDEARKNDLKTLDYATYKHIWEGAYLERSAAQIFADKFSVEAFTPTSAFNGPYQGIDFGFSQDPTAAVRSWIFENCLYIEKEAVKTHLELDSTVPFIQERIPNFEKYVSYADNARPESILFLKRHGFRRIRPCKKGRGSVEDGIEFIKSFSRVIIHPDCHQVIEEFENYSFKTDPLSGDILPDIVDEFNHCIDAIRYSLERVMKRTRGLRVRQEG